MCIQHVIRRFAAGMSRCLHEAQVCQHFQSLATSKLPSSAVCCNAPPSLYSCTALFLQDRWQLTWQGVGQHMAVWASIREACIWC